jgi:hypothetical protein
MVRTENNRSKAPEEAIVCGRFIQATWTDICRAPRDIDPAHRRSGEKRAVDRLARRIGGWSACSSFRRLEARREAVQGHVVKFCFAQSQRTLKHLIVGKAVEQGKFAGVHVTTGRLGGDQRPIGELVAHGAGGPTHEGGKVFPWPGSYRFFLRGRSDTNPHTKW